MPAMKEKAGAKKEAMSLLRKLPEGATIAEMIDELKLLEALRESEEDFAAGRTYTHAEVVAMSKKWIAK